MELAALHALGAVFSAGVALLGRYSLRNPGALARFFTFGASAGSRFGEAYGRVAGRFFLVFGIIGVLLFLIAIPVDLVSLRQ
jgi:hypothetical protein